MTICIACKVTRPDGTVITRTASDSEVSFGSKRLRGITKSCEKVIQFNGASVAASGSGCVFEALDILKTDQEYANNVQFKTRADIRTFAIDLYTELDSLVDQAKISKEDVSIGAILITTETTVWSIYQDLSIFEFDEWTCTGSGADTAYGLMLSEYRRLDNCCSEEALENMLIDVIERTCEAEQGCGPPVKVYTPLAPNPPKTKKSRKKKLTNLAPNDKIASEEGVTKRANKKRAK